MSDVLDDLVEELQNLEREDVARQMIEDGEPEEKVIKYSRLSALRVKELMEIYRLQPV